MRVTPKRADKSAEPKAKKKAKPKAAKKRKGPSQRTSGVLSLLGAFVATSVALGLLLAGVLLPMTGVAGVSIKNGVRLFDDMPGDSTINALSQSSQILAADGSVIATPYSQNRIVVKSDQIPKVMKNAQVAIEDERFYEHGALDRKGIARAFVANLFSSSTQGASTLTQQYVKVAAQQQALSTGNASAAAEAVSRSGESGYVRKIEQLKQAVNLEKKYTKDQILTAYLNTVYFGSQQYGIEAASMHYFGHSAKDLTLPEAATLAGVVNLPGTTDPISNPKAAKKRRDIVLNKMAQQHMITQDQAKAAIATPLTTHVKNFSGGCASSKYPYYCDYVTNWLLQQPALGKTVQEREGTLQTGGLVVKTALDPKKTKSLNDQLKKSVPVNNPYDVQDAGVIIQPGSGLVQAMGQDTNYNVAGTNYFNTSLNYTTSGFPLGSSAKLFAIVEAMQQGQTADSTVNVPPMTEHDSDGDYAPFTSKNLGGPCGQQRGVWPVHNDDSEPAGPMKLIDATGKSVNTAFATLVGKLGACKVRDQFAKFGVMRIKTTDHSLTEIGKDPSAIVLGNDASSAVMLANAYATIAAEGKYCTPRPVVSVSQANGKQLKLNVPACKQIITRDQALNVAKIFHGPLEGQGTAANAKLADGRDAFGKTGTVGTDNHTWFVGSTPQVTTAIWVGHANGAGAIKDVTLDGKHISGFLFGGDVAAPTWKAVMDDILKGQPKPKFPDPKGWKDSDDPNSSSSSSSGDSSSDSSNPSSSPTSG